MVRPDLRAAETREQDTAEGMTHAEHSLVGEGFFVGEVYTIDPSGEDARLSVASAPATRWTRS